MTQLGGAAVSLAPEELQLSRGESMPDTARALSRYLDALAVRTHAHDELEEWAEWASIPVINALTADEHPCQALADALTIRDRLGSLDGVRVALGRRRHERLVSLAELGEAARLRGRRRVPAGLRAGRRHATLVARPARGRGAAPTCVVTDTWISMGQEAEASSGCATSSPTASTTRCSPRRRPTRSSCTACRRTRARRSPPRCSTASRSAIWDEAENRLHVQKALLALLLA